MANAATYQEPLRVF